MSEGTVEERQMPSIESRSSRPDSRTPSSSPVRSASVATRRVSPSSASSNRPKTVCVFPTSTARSSVPLFVVAQRLADPVGERLGGELGLLALAAELLDGDVARGVHLGARDHSRRAVLVPDPHVLHPQVEERIA